MNKKKHSVDVLFMFALFAVFAILSVLIIYIGSGVYDRITENKEINEQTRTTLAYIANKVRETDGREDVYLKEADGVEVLVMKRDDINVLIYEYDGKLREMTVGDGDISGLQFGEVLIDTDGIDFEIDNDKKILTIKVYDEEKQEQSIDIFLGMSER